MTRREFAVGAGAAAVAGANLWAADSSASVGGRVLRRGFQVYAVRDLCERDFPGTLKAAKALGYEGVETGRFYGRDAKGLKAVCEDAGLELFALQLYPDTLVGDELKKTIRFCHECGCECVNTAWFKGSSENERDWQLVVNVLNAAAPVLRREGIRLGYHNHDQEFRIRFGGKTVCEWLFERFSPLVKQEFDPGWCSAAGEDPVKWLKEHPGRNPTVHVMPGYGTDWPAVFAELRRQETEWLVAKPTSHPDSLDGLRAVRQLSGWPK